MKNMMQNNLPNAVLMELTSICNHQCLFCYCPWENDKNYNLKELPTTDWCAILDKLKTYGVEEVTFTGGEASTRKDLFEIIDHAHKLGYRIGLISNGKLLDENFKVTHKSCIVNTKRVTALDWKDGKIIFDDDTEIFLLSKTHKKELKDYVTV